MNFFFILKKSKNHRKNSPENNLQAIPIRISPIRQQQAICWTTSQHIMPKILFDFIDNEKTNSFFLYLSNPSISNTENTTLICQQPNVETKKNYNPGQNWLKLYSILAKVRFATSKTKLDISSGKLHLLVSS